MRGGASLTMHTHGFSLMCSNFISPREFICMIVVSSDNISNKNGDATFTFVLVPERLRTKPLPSLLSTENLKGIFKAFTLCVQESVLSLIIMSAALRYESELVLQHHVTGRYLVTGFQRLLLIHEHSYHAIAVAFQLCYKFCTHELNIMSVLGIVMWIIVTQSSIHATHQYCSVCFLYKIQQIDQKPSSCWRPHGRVLILVHTLFDV